MQIDIKRGDVWDIEISDHYLKIIFDGNVYLLREKTGETLALTLENNMRTMELWTITEIAAYEGRYGGPSTLCSLCFELKDGTRVRGFFARLTQQQNDAGDFMTAVAMPLPPHAA